MLRGLNCTYNTLSLAAFIFAGSNLFYITKQICAHCSSARYFSHIIRSSVFIALSCSLWKCSIMFLVPSAPLKGSFDPNNRLCTQLSSPKCSVTACFVQRCWRIYVHDCQDVCEMLMQMAARLSFLFPSAGLAAFVPPLEVSKTVSACRGVVNK